MGQADEAVRSGHDEWRTQLIGLRQRYGSPIGDIETLYDLLLAPLDLLDLVPTSELGTRESKHAHWSRLNLGDLNREDALRQCRWIGDVQAALLRTVLPDWQRSLNDESLLDLLLRQWFAPTESTSEDESDQCTTRGAILVNSLQTFTLLLADKSQSHDSNEKQVSSDTWQLLQRCLRLFLSNASLEAIAQYCKSIAGRAQSELIWTDATRQLISLPDRLANAFQGKIPDDFLPERIRSLVATQADQMAASDADLEKSAGTLVSRMLRAGWFHDSMNWTIPSACVWPSLLRAIAVRIESGHVSSPYTNRWHRAVSTLNEKERSELLISLISVVDRHCFKASHIGNLLNGTEHIRPGAEGTKFLSQETWNDALRVASVMEKFVIDDRADEHGVNSDLARVMEESASRTWSPLMARLLVHLLLKSYNSEEHVSHLMTLTIGRWATQTKTSSLDEETYMTTVLALLIASLPSGSSSIGALATSSHFIKGVSNHLEHLSPAVRRMGMLLAELVTEKQGKSLNFGARMWNGRGDGREEARILRALALGFPSRVQKVDLATGDILSSLCLHKAVGFEAAVAYESLRPGPLRREASTPQSRSLPARKAAPKRRNLIEVYDENEQDLPDSLGIDTDSNLPALDNIDGSVPKPKISMISDDDDASSSSSESDSSDDEEDTTDGKTDDKESLEEGKAFGMGAPSAKKKPRAPVYVYELSPLLRQNERASVRIGLKHASELVSRKAGWGGEVNENGVDVCLALCALQNNFRIKDFDQRRVNALTALVVASPDRIAPCLIEQYYLHQYSMAQRIAMLNALAFGATQLATGKKVSQSENKDVNLLKGFNTSELAHQLEQMAITQARKEGDERMPEMKREQSLLVNDKKSKPRTQERLTVRSKNDFSPFASSSFIFPLVNRLWSHLQTSNSRGFSIASRTRGGGGSSIIDMPFMMGALLDTLSVLCFHAQNEPHFRTEIIPAVVELLLTFTRPYIAQIAHAGKGALLLEGNIDDGANEDDGYGGSGGGSRSTILGAAASLVLVLLDAAWNLDFGKVLVRQQGQLLTELQQWASALFEAADGSALSSDRSTGKVDRTGRTSAAILLRLYEMQEHHRT